MLQLNNLIDGAWYVPVFKRLQPLIDSGVGEFYDNFRDDSPFYQFIAPNEFIDEAGELVDGFYDPELGGMVATSSADGFV